MSKSAPPLPRWADLFLLPLINLMAALVSCGLLVLAIGENPIQALGVMLKGAFVYSGGLGYTLYYTTNFVFTGLAVATAFHAMLWRHCVQRPKVPLTNYGTGNQRINHSKAATTGINPHGRPTAEVIKAGRPSRFH